MSQMFCSILACVCVWHVYQVTKVVQAVEGILCIVVVGVLTCFVLLHSMHDLKTAQINVQCNLIWELMPYELELGQTQSISSQISQMLEFKIIYLLQKHFLVKY